MKSTQLTDPLFPGVRVFDSVPNYLGAMKLADEIRTQTRYMPESLIKSAIIYSKVSDMQLIRSVKSMFEDNPAAMVELMGSELSEKIKKFAV